MTEIKVPDMHCERCVERITASLNELKLKFSVSLEDKTVTIDGCASCTEKAKKALDDLGFTAE